MARRMAHTSASCACRPRAERPLPAAADMEDRRVAEPGPCISSRLSLPARTVPPLASTHGQDRSPLGNTPVLLSQKSEGHPPTLAERSRRAKARCRAGAALPRSGQGKCRSSLQRLIESACCFSAARVVSARPPAPRDGAGGESRRQARAAGLTDPAHIDVRHFRRPIGPEPIELLPGCTASRIDVRSNHSATSPTSRNTSRACLDRTFSRNRTGRSIWPRACPAPRRWRSSIASAR